MHFYFCLFWIWHFISLVYSQTPTDGSNEQRYNTRVFNWAMDFEEQNRRFSGERPFLVGGGEIFNRTNYIIHPNEPADLVVVTVHGFNMDGRQFQNLGRDLALNHHINWFNLVLPGHGEDRSNAKNIDGQQLAKALNDLVTFACTTGKKLVLVGQSTGGVLAFGELLRPENKNCIHGMALVEPALVVNQTITAAACATSMFFESGTDLLPILQRLSSAPNFIQRFREDISPVLGCNIDDLRHLIEKRAFADHPEYCCPVGQQDAKSFSKPNIIDLCSNLVTPTLLINRPGDQVVDAIALEQCAKRNAAIKYQEIKDGRKHAQTLLDETTPEGQAIKDFILNLRPSAGAIRLISTQGRQSELKQAIDSIDQLGKILQHLDLGHPQLNAFGHQGLLFHKIFREVELDNMLWGRKNPDISGPLPKRSYQVYETFISQQMNTLVNIQCHQLNPHCLNSKNLLTEIYGQIQKIFLNHPEEQNFTERIVFFLQIKATQQKISQARVSWEIYKEFCLSKIPAISRLITPALIPLSVQSQ